MTQAQTGIHGVDLVPQGTAYGLLIGLGILFCGVILIAIKVQKAYLSEDSATSEMFMVANRSVGTGLTASAVFSSWMWINETVLSAAMCYRYGLAVPLVCLAVYLHTKLSQTNRHSGGDQVSVFRLLLWLLLESWPRFGSLMRTHRLRLSRCDTAQLGILSSSS